MEMQTNDTFDLCNEGFSALEAEKLRFTTKDKQLLEKKKNRCSLTAVFYPPTVTFCNYARKTRVKSWKSLQMPNRTFANKLVARILQQSVNLWPALIYLLQPK
jgi:hypothetical protein